MKVKVKQVDVETYQECLNQRPFGRSYGDFRFEITQSDIETLQNGKFLVLDVGGEYVAYLNLKKVDNE